MNIDTTHIITNVSLDDICYEPLNHYGSSGTSGRNGLNGISGLNGKNGTNGTNGTSGINGIGKNGTSGTSGITQDISQIEKCIGDINLALKIIIG